MYKITIIIPVYNAGRYLKQLLESIINQTLDFKQIEVIMVDDCSIDNSREIMNQYSSKYKNFISLSLKTNNKIAGKARNEGVKAANGKYLMFADADDFLPCNACEIMYNTIEKMNADFITANYKNADEDGTLWKYPIFNLKKYKNFKLSKTDYNKSFFVLNSSVCNKIFNRQFVQKNNLKFLEGVPAEDAYFTNMSFIKSKNVYYIKDIVYYYRQRNNNRGNNSVSFNCTRDYFRGINIAYKSIYENFKNHNLIAFYRYIYAKNMSYILYKFIDSTLLTDKERIQILKDMRWFYELSKTLKVPACQKCQEMVIEKIIDKDYKCAIDYCKLIADIRTYLTKETKENMSRPDSNMYNQISEFDNEYCTDC